MIQFLKEQFRMLYQTDRTWMIREKLYWQFIRWKIAPEAIRSLVKYSYGCKWMLLDITAFKVLTSLFEDNDLKS